MEASMAILNHQRTISSVGLVFRSSLLVLHWLPSCDRLVSMSVSVVVKDKS
jgi:hypothetical protein